MTLDELRSGGSGCLTPVFKCIHDSEKEPLLIFLIWGGRYPSLVKSMAVINTSWAPIFDAIIERPPAKPKIDQDVDK